MEFAKDETKNSKLDLSKIDEIHKNAKIDVDLIDQFVKHMNRVYDRNPESFLLDNGSYLQIGLIKKQMDETMKEVNQVLDKLNEFKVLKNKLEQINKCILFDII
jgi:cellulose biosynthesis protein BcsQ